MGKDGKKCEMTKIGCSEPFWTTLVGKKLEKAGADPGGAPGARAPPDHQK